MSRCAPISNSHRACLRTQLTWHAACLRTQLTWHAPSQAEFGFPFWSSDEREIRAWRLSREHAQMRRLSEEQRKKGAPGAADGKRKVKTSLCDRAEAETTAQQLARDEDHGAQQCLERSAAAARALEASFATRLVVDGRPSLATAVDAAVKSTDADASRQSCGLTQTGLNPSAAPPSTHIWSSRFRKSWNPAPTVASAPVAKPTPAKRKPPVATEPAATADVDKHSGLPDGWVCRVHEKSAENIVQYKRYKGPNGERAQSMKQAWALHAAGQNEAEAEGEGGGEEVDDQLVEACIPEGYERLPWVPGQPVRWFMLWQPASVHSDVQWHFGEVVKALPRNQSYTHDAWLQGMLRQQKLGVDLSQCHHDVGSWVLLRKKE